MVFDFSGEDAASRLGKSKVTVKYHNMIVSILIRNGMCVRVFCFAYFHMLNE